MTKNLIFRPFGDGGGLVTKTHDVESARACIRQAFVDEQFDKEEIDDFMELEFPASHAELEIGRVVVCNPDNHPAGWSWMWKRTPDDHIGRPGVTRAVAWRI